MAPKQPWRIPLLGWGNQVVGVLAPIGAFSNILQGLRVFSFRWAGEDIVLTTLLGLGLGYLHWSSGRAVLHRRPWAYQRTCAAAGAMIGYTSVGMLFLLASGLDRSLINFIRHGSDDWWDWSLDHFQNSAVREIPVLAWSVFSLGTVVRHRFASAPERIGDRIGLGFSISFCWLMIAGLGRFLQIGSGGLLSSQR